MSTFNWLYRGTVKRIIDGDTILVDLDLGLDIHLKDQYIRLNGLNTPEIRGPEKELGKIAKKFVESQIPIGSRVDILSEKYDPHGKYGRIVGVVWFGTAADDDLNSILLESGYAIPYNGKGKMPRFDINAKYPLEK